MLVLNDSALSGGRALLGQAIDGNGVSGSALRAFSRSCNNAVQHDRVAVNDNVQKLHYKDFRKYSERFVYSGIVLSTLLSSAFRVSFPAFPFSLLLCLPFLICFSQVLLLQCPMFGCPLLSNVWYGSEYVVRDHKFLAFSVFVLCV